MGEIDRNSFDLATGQAGSGVAMYYQYGFTREACDQLTVDGLLVQTSILSNHKGGMVRVAAWHLPETTFAALEKVCERAPRYKRDTEHGVTQADIEAGCLAAQETWSENERHARLVVSAALVETLCVAGPSLIRRGRPVKIEY